MKTFTKLIVTLTAALTIHSAAATENTAAPTAEATVVTTQIAATPLQLAPIPGSEAKGAVNSPERSLPVLNLMTISLLGFCGYATFLIIRPLFKKEDFEI